MIFKKKKAFDADGEALDEILSDRQTPLEPYLKAWRQEEWTYWLYKYAPLPNVDENINNLLW